MLIILIIFIVGFTPALISAWISLRARHRFQGQLEWALETTAQRGVSAYCDRNPDVHYTEGLGYVIGDISCQMNARSPYLRCAINPLGPCTTCPNYQPRCLT